MHILDFFDYNKNCPICDCLLTSDIHFQIQQDIKLENNRTIIIFPLRSVGDINNKIGYSFGLQDDSFSVEFYNSDMEKIEKVSDDLINTGLMLNRHLGPFQFHRQCVNCKRYLYNSNNFKLDILGHKYDPLIVQSESFGFIEYFDGIKPISKYHKLDKNYPKTKYQIYKLYNDYTNKISTISYWDSFNFSDVNYDEGITGSPFNSLNLPIIKYVSYKRTLSRLKTLILFS
jgi:hypothetical protein